MNPQGCPVSLLRFAEGDDTALPTPMDNLPVAIATALDCAKRDEGGKGHRFLQYARIAQDVLHQLQALGPCTTSDPTTEEK